MNGYSFTDSVRRALAQARTEAVRLHHEYVGTEHLLLALLRHEDTVAFQVIKACNVDPAGMNDLIEATVMKGRLAQTGPDLPYTSRAKKVLEEAMSEAAERGQPYVGTEHLLLGLIREEKGIAAQILVDSGASYDVASRKTTEVLGGGATEDSRPRTPAGTPGTAAGAMLAAIIAKAVRSPEIAAVFAAHGIDVPRLLHDLTAEPPAK